MFTNQKRMVQHALAAHIQKIAAENAAAAMTKRNSIIIGTVIMAVPTVFILTLNLRR